MAACGVNIQDDADVDNKDEKYERVSRASYGSPEVISLTGIVQPKDDFLLGKVVDQYTDDMKLTEKEVTFEEDDYARFTKEPSVINMTGFPTIQTRHGDSMVQLEPEANLLVLLNHEEVREIIKKVVSPPLRSPPIMLYGAQGTGKTYLIKQVVAEVGDAISFFSVSAKDFKGVKEHDAVQLVQDTLEKANSNNPSVVLLDDAEFIPSKASKLITINRKNVQVIGLTGRPMDMDVSMLEAFVDKYHLNHPSIETIENVFTDQLKELAKNLDENEYKSVMGSLGAVTLSMSEVKTLLEKTLSSSEITLKIFIDNLEKLKSVHDDAYVMVLNNWSARYGR